MTAPPSEQRPSRWGDDQRLREKDLIATFSTLPDGPERQAVRDELVTMHLPLVKHLARRYRDRGETLDDLVQVGTVGLINAVDRYDPTRGVEFSTFATPTILGEIRRHFRDRAWAVKVPRRLQELQSSVASTTESLTHSLGRTPTVREIAESLGATSEDVLDALEVRGAYAASSLDAGADDSSDGPHAVVHTLGGIDPALEEVEYRESLRPLLEALPERERRIVLLRFFHNQSQSQIAEQLGISQMHVSRLLARSLAMLRQGMAEVDG